MSVLYFFFLQQSAIKPYIKLLITDCKINNNITRAVANANGWVQCLCDKSFIEKNNLHSSEV